jgi:hypothetical protein
MERIEFRSQETRNRKYNMDARLYSAEGIVINGYHQAVRFGAPEEMKLNLLAELERIQGEERLRVEGQGLSDRNRSRQGAEAQII